MKKSTNAGRFDGAEMLEKGHSISSLLGSQIFQAYLCSCILVKRSCYLKEIKQVQTRDKKKIKINSREAEWESGMKSGIKKN